MAANGTEVTVRSGPIADVCPIRDHAGMKTVTIDCAGVSSTEEFWLRYLDATQPEGRVHFGRNLNAFWDAIEGGGPGWPGEVVLEFQHADALSALSVADSGSLLDGLREIAEKTTAGRIKFS